MNLQWAGVALALVTFCGIGAGHVLVRRLYARHGTRPAIPLLLLGGLVMAGSLSAANDLLSGILGVSAVTILWDGVEIYRQKKRMMKK